MEELYIQTKHVWASNRKRDLRMKTGGSKNAQAHQGRPELTLCTKSCPQIDDELTHIGIVEVFIAMQK
jgi:hypothetical protein